MRVDLAIYLVGGPAQGLACCFSHLPEALVVEPTEHGKHGPPQHEVIEVDCGLVPGEIADLATAKTRTLVSGASAPAARYVQMALARVP